MSHKSLEFVKKHSDHPPSCAIWSEMDCTCGRDEAIAELEHIEHLKSLKINTLEAKWLDPECHQGCQSLVFKQKIATARHDALTEAAQVNVEFVMPTGYTGINLVKGIHFNSGHAHGVADTRQAILSLRDQKPQTKGE